MMSRAPRPSSLADVLDLILDKGLVIDAYVRVSVAGIEVLTVDARVVVASVDTYLRFAEAVNRLDLGQNEQQGLPALFGDRSNGAGQRSGDGNGNRRERTERSRQRNGARDGHDDETGRRRGRSAEVTAGDQGGESGGLLDRITERARFTS